MANDTLVALSEDLTQAEQHIVSRIAAAHRAATAQEKAEINKYRADQDNVSKLIHDLAWETLIRLEQSEAVASLATSIDSLDSGLKQTIEDLKGIQRFADTLAQVFEFVDQVIKGLAALKIV
jgi:hypothetical protein